MFMGLRYALYSLLWRDGEPYESPEYNAHWVTNVGQLASLLPRLGREVSSLPRLRRLFDAPLAAIAIGRYTPAVGDSFTVYGGNALDENRTAYRAAFNVYHDPRYAQAGANTGEGRVLGAYDFNSLLQPPPADATEPATAKRLPAQASRILSGFGLALLNDPADTTALSLYYGLHVTHSHFDRLTFELFAQGQPLMPELGYPDGMNELVAGVYTWSLNTISHNTMTVDASTQAGNVAGAVELFADGGWARAMAISADGSYPQCDVYRRTQVMVDAGQSRNYVVDVFDVRGGRQHDYSLHGPPGTFQRGPGDWIAQARGTLAGENVALGEIYDDPKLGAKNYLGGFVTYRGSGFQHFENVSRLAHGEAFGDYTHEKDPMARLRIRILPQPGQEIISTQARVTPVKYPQPVHYLIARKTATGAGVLTSRFVSTLEPNQGNPPLRSVERIDLADGVALIAARDDDGTDLIIVGEPGIAKQLATPKFKLTTMARVTVAAFDDSGKQLRRWSADEGDGPDGVGMAGKVSGVSLENSIVTVRLESDPGAAAVSALAGRVVHLGEDRRTANMVTKAALDGRDLALTLRDDLILGLARVTAVKRTRVTTATSLILADSYAGTYLYSSGGRLLGRIKHVDADGIDLAAPVSPADLRAGEDVWIADTAPGEPFVLPKISSERG
jgi:hypothetical protein